MVKQSKKRIRTSLLALHEDLFCLLHGTLCFAIGLAVARTTSMVFKVSLFRELQEITQNELRSVVSN